MMRANNSVPVPYSLSRHIYIYIYIYIYIIFSAIAAIDTSGIAFLIGLQKATEKGGLEVYSSCI
jgi:hypothetical protein